MHVNEQIDDRRPLVSVHMPAYNHERYIAEAIESALSQNATFAYEIVIGEDCSTDGTRSIVIDYAKRFPQRIKALLHPRNLGIYENDQAIIRACRGKYIAWLEADDVWLDGDKLQKQVSLMEQNQDYAATFHWARFLGDESRKPATWKSGPPTIKPWYSVDDLLRHGHFIPSCTVVFRRELVGTAAAWTQATSFLETTYSIWFALSGKIGFIDEELAAFRYNPDGIYGRLTDAGNIEAAIQAHRLVGEHFDVGTRRSYGEGLRRMYGNLGRAYFRAGRIGRAVAAWRHAYWPPQGGDTTRTRDDD